MDDLLREFLTETNESLERLDGELVRLEQDPEDPELFGLIFRQFHTIKGTCGFLGLPRLEAIAHAAESVLGMWRDGEVAISPDAVGLILESLDRIKELLAKLEANGCEPSGDDGDIIRRLTLMAEGSAVPRRLVQPAADSLFGQMGGLGVLDAAVDIVVQRIAAEPRFQPALADVDLDRLQGGERAHLARLLGGSLEGEQPHSLLRFLAGRGVDEEAIEFAISALRRALETLDVPTRICGRIVSLVRAERRADAAPSRPQPSAQASATAAPPRLASSSAGKPATPPAPSPAPPAEPPRPSAERPPEPIVAANTIRVNVDLLETLMTTVSELVLTRNQLLRLLRAEEESAFAAPLQRLNHVTAELQDRVMRTRLQPIGNAWTKLPRLIRELARELGKKIHLEMSGAETELDRQVLEIVRDPLTHMVRNSADHGLETPEERVRAGKPETGTIRLSALHEGGHIVISVADDGHGIPIDRIKAKAAASGVIGEAELAGMTDQQAVQLIFQPGFTTAEAVTSVSGRGVGMDVVRTNIERIGGTIEIATVAGAGVTFTMRIPLTLAIVPALLVEAAGGRFAIPQINVRELVHASPDTDRRIEWIGDTPVLRLRDRLLPLVSLAGLLGESNGRSPEDAFVVVTQVGATSFGLIVDELFDTEEIVVKPVPPILRDIPIYSGNTILGDGSVVMILDPNGIANAAGELVVAEERTRRADSEQVAVDQGREPLLLFRTADPAPKAVPLSLVGRLEEVATESIERSGGGAVVQYRGRLMPLVSLGSSEDIRRTGRQPVIVLAERGVTVGIVAEEIIDIVEDRVEITLGDARDGILGSAVVAGRATEIVDAHYVLAKARTERLVLGGAAEGAPEAQLELPQLELEYSDNIARFDPDAPRRSKIETITQGAA